MGDKTHPWGAPVFKINSFDLTLFTQTGKALEWSKVFETHTALKDKWEWYKGIKTFKTLNEKGERSKVFKTPKTPKEKVEESQLSTAFKEIVE